VEKRWRHSQGARPIAALCVSMVALGLAGALLASGQWRGRHGDDPLLRTVLDAKKDRYSWPHSITLASPNSQTIKMTGAIPRRILLMGDSHVWQYVPRLQALLERNPEAPITFHLDTFGGCTMISHMMPTDHFGDIRDPCLKTRESALQSADSSDFDTIVLGGYWNSHLFNDNYEYVANNTRIPLSSREGREAVLRELGLQLGAWVKQGKKVYLLLDTPSPGDRSQKPEKLIHGSRWGRPNVSPVASFVPWEPEQASLHARMRDIALSNGAQVIDPIPVLCHDGQCLRAMPDGMPIYHDNDHLRASYVREHATWMDVLVAP
jgi:hypothetical protein